MVNLGTFTFTPKNDTAQLLTEGWTVELDQTVYALAGNDYILGYNNAGIGILNRGTLLAGKGDDVIRGTSRDASIGLFNEGENSLISLGNGSNNLNGTATSVDAIAGLRNDGTILGGSEYDNITGSSGSIGLLNYGLIDAGAGDDRVGGIEGDDYCILNYGVIRTGEGDEIIGAYDYANPVTTDYGIANLGSGVINTGSGIDKIWDFSSLGLYNEGTIKTGKGEDEIDVRYGGFHGSGITNLGADDDTLKGFGTGTFVGGSGSDTILLGKGTYAINAVDGTIISGNTTMNINSFELIGGTNGGLFDFATGTLTVNSAGIGTFL